MAKQIKLTPWLQDYIIICHQIAELRQKLMTIEKEVNGALAGHPALLYREQDSDREIPQVITKVELTYNNGPELFYEVKENPIQLNPDKLVRRNLDGLGLIVEQN